MKEQTQPLEIIDEENFEINLDAVEKILNEGDGDIDIELECGLNSEIESKENEDIEDIEEDEEDEESDIRGTRESRDKKTTGPEQIEMFSRMDLRCFNAHERRRQERQNIYKSFSKEDWESLRKWIFGMSNYNPANPQEIKQNNEEQ